MSEQANGEARSNDHGPCRGGRVAFFGGSFDPPHLGHLAIARAAREALRLDRVLFVPVGMQPLKRGGSTASFPDRLAMTELAVAGEPGFEVSLADAPSAKGEPNYTLETLRRLRASLSPQACLFCLIGADSFRSLREWRGANEIPFAASLIVASRPGQKLDDVAGFLPRGLTLESAETEEGTWGPGLPDEGLQATAEIPGSAGAGIELRSFLVRGSDGNTGRFYLLPGLDIEISASEIRDHLRGSVEGSEAALSLPAPVVRYIRAHGLYR
jgi:nicotinate-nucleotide adenylyltransferase